jgi:hypothetical protein
VRRTQAARRDDEVELQRLTESGLQLLGTVADDAHTLGLDAPRGELSGQEGTVLVGSSASDELAARDEDGCSRRHYARGAASLSRFAVTNTDFGELVLGSLTTRPFTVIRRFPGRRMRTK